MDSEQNHSSRLNRIRFSPRSGSVQDRNVNMNDNTLIIFTDKYPYGNRETFIDNERSYWKSFKEVYICPVLLQKHDKIRSEFEPKEYEKVIPLFNEALSIKKILCSILGGLPIHFLFFELNSLYRNKKLSKVNIKLLLYVFFTTNIRIKQLKAYFYSKGIKIVDHHILLYSYWMFEPALVALGINKGKSLRHITRCHGYDIYNERHKNNYIPYQETVLRNASAIYPICTNGKDYLSNLYETKYDSKIIVKRLGTIKSFDSNRFNEVITCNSNGIVLVSCSNLVREKRINRIIEGLSLSSRRIDWYHFGDGELMHEIENMASSLPSNIHAHLLGFKPNTAVQLFYSENKIDAFLNTSATEGVPVSIMEAQSYGLPVIATDVGGTSEIVHNNINGILLPKDFSDQDFIEAIESVVKDEVSFRNAARQTWHELSNARKVYSDFFENESEILRSNG